MRPQGRRRACSRPSTTAARSTWGAPADVAILELREGTFEFVDNYKGTRTGSQRLFPAGTVLAGQAGAARLGGDAEKKNPAEAGLDFAAFGVFRTAFGLMLRRPDRLYDYPFISARVGL